MHQMAQSSVFLSGMGGLGIEIGRLSVTLLQYSNLGTCPLTWVYLFFLFFFYSKKHSFGWCEGMYSSYIMTIILHRNLFGIKMQMLISEA